MLSNFLNNKQLFLGAGFFNDLADLIRNGQRMKDRQFKPDGGEYESLMIACFDQAFIKSDISLDKLLDFMRICEKNALEHST